MRDPDEVVAAIRAASSDPERIEIERAAVTDTAEEEPGEVEDDHDGGHGQGRRPRRG
jgi:hypothetical protein